jgi:hypothetical protein
MSYTGKTKHQDFLTTSATAILTIADNKKTRIKSIDLFNQDSSPITVNIWLAPNDGGSARTVSGSDRYKRVTVIVMGLSCLGLEVDWILDATNDTIQASASTASKVSAVINYIEVT